MKNLIINQICNWPIPKKKSLVFVHCLVLILHLFKYHMVYLVVIYIVLLLYVPINSYGHGGTVSSPNHTFFLGKLKQVFDQYFVHILSLVTDNNTLPTALCGPV